MPHQLYIPGEDHERFDLSVYFDQAADWIKDKLEETNILVHCLAGVSRSVSLVLAYLMKHKGMNFDDAFYSVKSRRKIVNPFLKIFRFTRTKDSRNNSESGKES